jgi:hypothetical protein
VGCPRSKLDLKRLIATLEKRKPSPALGLKFPHRAQIAAQRRKLAKRLEPFFVNAGLDVVGINKVLAESQNELRRVLRGPPSQQKKTFADAQKFPIGIAEATKLLSTLLDQFNPLYLHNLRYALFPLDPAMRAYWWTRMEPWNSWAKLLGQRQTLWAILRAKILFPVDQPEILWLLLISTPLMVQATSQGQMITF